MAECGKWFPTTLLIVAVDISSPLTPIGVPPWIDGRKALEYTELFEVFRLMNAGKFSFSAPRP